MNRARRQYKVYLSGPIASISPAEALTWRDYAQKFLFTYSKGDVIGVCPMRYSDYVKGKTAEEMVDDVVGNRERIKKRCMYDVKDCDMMLVNVKGAPSRISMGTNIEVGAATILDKYIIGCCDKGDQYDLDVLFGGCIGDSMYYDLDIALKRCCDFLLP